MRNRPLRMLLACCCCALLTLSACRSRSAAPEAGPATPGPPVPTVATSPADAAPTPDSPPGPASPADAAPSLPAVDEPATPNEFFARRPLTFVLGTAGDDAADARIATQVGLLRDLLFPDAAVVPDTSINVSQGREAWPEYPVLYGAPHENAALAALAAGLPFELTAERLVLGGERFEGEGYRLITVVPGGERHPAFVLYAGTGPAGVAEINAGLPGDFEVLVADAFGPLTHGRWDAADGAPRATLEPRARRIEWRTVERELPGFGGGAKSTVRFLWPQMVPEWGGETGMIEAALRGLATVVARLEIAAPEPLAIYVYPDRRSKASLTGDEGDGRAVPSSRALHVLAVAPRALEALVTHEATHVLGYFAWGPVRTPLLGEGLAVWTSGGYGGQTLETWKTRFPTPPALDTLLGPEFLRLPEADKYPPAGVLVETAVALLGPAAVRAHLLPAGRATWEAACVAAGTTAEALQQAYAKAFAGG